MDRGVGESVGEHLYPLSFTVSSLSLQICLCPRLAELSAACISASNLHARTPPGTRSVWILRNALSCIGGLPPVTSSGVNGCELSDARARDRARAACSRRPSTVSGSGVGVHDADPDDTEFAGGGCAAVAFALPESNRLTVEASDRQDGHSPHTPPPASWPVQSESMEPTCPDVLERHAAHCPHHVPSTAWSWQSIPI